MSATVTEKFGVWRSSERNSRKRDVGFPGRLLGTLSRIEDCSETPRSRFGAIVRCCSAPFRAIALVIEWMGRAASMLLGFLLMVGGAALMAGPLTWIGLPIFLFGLLLTLRALG